MKTLKKLFSETNSFITDAEASGKIQDINQLSLEDD